MKDEINPMNALFVNRLQICGIVDKMPEKDFIVVNNFSKLLVSNLQDPFQIPKWQMIENAYFSVKGNPCSYPLYYLVSVLNFTAYMGCDLSLFIPKDFSPMFVEANDIYGHKMIFAIAPRKESIHGEEINEEGELIG